MNGVGMDESDLESEEPLTRLLVDQVGARGREAVELGTDVVDLVGDMVHPRPAAREELADGCLHGKWGQQLDPAGTDQDSSRFDTLILDDGAVLELAAEQAQVGIEGFVQILDGDAEMVNSTGGHARDANGGLVFCRGEDADGADGLGRA